MWLDEHHPRTIHTVADQKGNALVGVQVVAINQDQIRSRHILQECSNLVEQQELVQPEVNLDEVARSWRVHRHIYTTKHEHPVTHQQ